MYIEGSKDLESLPGPGGLFYCVGNFVPCTTKALRGIALRRSRILFYVMHRPVQRKHTTEAAHVFGVSVTYYRMYSVRVKRGGIEHGKDPF